MPEPHIHILVPASERVISLSASQLRALRDILPPARLLLEPEQCADYGRDESPVAPALPAAVVLPESTLEVQAILALAHREHLPITPRGAGTGKVGGAIPLYGGLVLSLERMQARLDLDIPNRLAHVAPGIRTVQLRTAAEEAGLYYPVDPNSLESCSLGGNAATNAAGPASMKYGATRDHVLGLEVILADGTRLETGRQTTKCSTGYDLSSLFTGSEGTLGVITGLTLRLRARPSQLRTLFATFPTTSAATRSLTQLWQHGIVPCAAEFFDRHALACMMSALGIAREAEAGLLLELDGVEAGIDAQLESLLELLGPAAAELLLATDEAQRRKLWEARRVLSHSVKKRFARWVSEDVAVPPGRLPELVEAIERLRHDTGLEILCYGHAGDGNLHVNFLYHQVEERPQVEQAVEALFRQVIRLGGTLSGEHGIGLSKRAYLGLEQAPELLRAQWALKKALDPRGILNRGKVFPPDQVEQG